MPTIFSYRSVAVCLLVLIAITANAESSVGVSAGIGRSDNITRTEVNKAAETIYIAGLDFAAFDETRRLSINAIGDLAYLGYQKKTYGNDVSGTLNGLLTLRLIPERFNWVVQESFGQVSTDAFAVVTPDMRENINFISTGPDIGLSLGSSTRAIMSGRYSQEEYEKRPFDNYRYSTALGLSRDLSGASSVSLNVQAEKTNYDDSAAIDFQRQEAFGRYTLKASRTAAKIELGYSKIKQPINNEQGALARIDLSRKITTASTLSVQVGRELTDSGTLFRFEQNLGLIGLDSVYSAQSTSPLTSEYISGGWAFVRQRTGVNLAISRNNDSYYRAAFLDQTRTAAGLTVYRDLTSNVRWQIAGAYSTNELKNVAGDFNELAVSTNLDWQVGKFLSVILEVQHFDRSSDLSTGVYKENRGWLRFRYGQHKVQAPSVFATSN